MKTGELDNGPASASTPPAPERRPYRAPQLKHLGSVRELTLGKTTGPSEGNGFNPQIMMM